MPTGASDRTGSRGGAPRRATRIPVTLACTECKARNYKTTKAADETSALELSKFCRACKRHTPHRETK